MPHPWRWRRCSTSSPSECCDPPQDLMLTFESSRMPSARLTHSNQGPLVRVETGRLALPPKTGRKASWKMSVALPCQAHFQGLSVLSLLGSSIFSSGKPGYRPYVERRSPPTGLIHDQGLGAQPALELPLEQQQLLFILLVVGLCRWGAGSTGSLRLRAQLLQH